LEFNLTSNYYPSGDQPDAIKQLVAGVQRLDKAQVLLGVTGSGKTFTMANVIQQTQRPALILSHNKTLAAQLYSEFKQFFPNNAVEYFVSYYDYYQPEAYLPTTNTYIEKDLSINEEIEKLRLSTTTSLLSGRRDLIVVSSVSCIYGMGNPQDFRENSVSIKVGDKRSRNQLLHQLVQALYARTTADFKRGNFRVKGDTVDIYLAYDDIAYRVNFFGDEIEELVSIDPKTGSTIDKHSEVRIYPANLFVTNPERQLQAIWQIQEDLLKHIAYMKDLGKHLEAKRLEDRVTYDLEMIRELGYCSGIENYSRYFDGRATGARPFCLLDYFPDDYLLFIDESHVTVGQIKAMYGGDRSRKVNLVEYGFRLPAALDNRPLKFEEFLQLSQQTVYVSATPADYELAEAGGVVVEQVIRPTGLLDPIIEVRPSINQIDDLLDEINIVITRQERVLVTTLTKRMAEELAKYLTKVGIKCRYIHSEVETLERIEILRDLRIGNFDVLIGVNLLREGLDLPEVSLVAVLDADKEGFLRSNRSLTQTAGRAARNINGKVIFYADTMTDSMQKTIDETNRRREKQLAYNEKHGMVPKEIKKAAAGFGGQMLKDRKADEALAYIENEAYDLAADPLVKYMDADAIQKRIAQTKREMEKAAKELDFIDAARLRDEMFALEQLLKDQKK
jgi:excinuclease ABC subunit B